MNSTAAVLRETVESDAFAESRPASFETIQIEEPAQGEVLVEVGAASLCHTDNTIALGNLEESYPLVMGHEGAGIVQQIGPDVTSVSPGDHVVLGRTACGQCEYCRRGRSNLCTVRTESRANGTLRTGAVRFSADGEPIHHCHGVSSFSEFTLVTEEVAIPITDEIPLEQASLLGCGVFTGVGAVANTADVELGSSVVIFGAGGVGLSAVQGARLRGAGDIVVVDLVAEKLELAEQLGATETVDASKEDTVERVRSVLGGGADYAFDIVGIPEIVEEAIAVLAPTGTAVLVGTAAPGKNEHSLNMMDMVLGEQEIVGSFNGSYNLSLAIPKLAELVAKDDLHLDPLITDFRGLRELNEAMDDLEHGSHIRQVIKPN